ncbi:MAG: hypothetical protein HY394_02535 [Candidatus Diapherotrites archaeon]|nr:hypothetical protein [Candidatus Diapherotrites archaeon]
MKNAEIKKTKEETPSTLGNETSDEEAEPGPKPKGRPPKSSIKIEGEPQQDACEKMQQLAICLTSIDMSKLSWLKRKGHFSYLSETMRELVRAEFLRLHPEPPLWPDDSVWKKQGKDKTTVG